MDVKNLWCQFPYLRIRDGLLIRRHKNQGPLDDWQVVAPQTIRTKVFQACHHHKLAAHQGIVRTLGLLKRRFYWPNMHKDVEAWCQRCTVCGKCKAAVRGHGQLQQPTYGAFNERVSIDLMGPFKKTQNDNDYIVVMQDHFTKWVDGQAVCGKEALTVADAVVQEWVLKHGAPMTLHSDRGREFTAALHQGVCDLLRIAKTYSTAYRPQSNGMVEGCNRTLLAMLREVVSERQDDWDDHLPTVLSAYRATPHSSTGLSPHQMVYGIEMNLPVDLVFGEMGRERPAVHCPCEYVEWLRGSHRDAHALARANLKKAAKRQKRGYGESNRPVSFQRGDWVWRMYPPVSGGKLRYRNRGPWLVLTKVGPVTYKIQRHAEADPEIVHVDKLMPYQADFGEELQRWLQDTETTGHRVIGTQTCDPVPPAAEAEPVPSPVNEDEAGFSGSDSEGVVDTELEDDNIPAPATPPRRGLRPRRVPDRYAPINRIAYTGRCPYAVAHSSCQMSLPDTPMMMDPDWETESEESLIDSPGVSEYS